MRLAVNSEFTALTWKLERKLKAAHERFSCIITLLLSFLLGRGQRGRGAPHQSNKIKFVIRLTLGCTAVTESPISAAGQWQVAPPALPTHSTILHYLFTRACGELRTHLRDRLSARPPDKWTLCGAPSHTR